MPRIVAAAQQAYDQWEQDDEGYDEVLGGGGICQDIAEGIADVLQSMSIEFRTVNNNGVGDQHVWLIGRFKEGLFDIDIPPSVYETGGGYSWKKIPGVKFVPQHVQVHRSYMSEEDYEADW